MSCCGCSYSMHICSQGRSLCCPLRPPANSERLPSSFAASFLNKISCEPQSYPPRIHRSSATPLPPCAPQRSRPPPRLCAGTVIKTSFPLLQQGKTFKIQTAAALSVHVWHRQILQLRRLLIYLRARAHTLTHA